MSSERFLLSAFLLVLVFSIISVTTLSSAEEYFKEPRDLDEDTFLQFDENTPTDVDLFFDIEESDRIRPKKNDFEMMRFSPMSNKIGERWVLISVRNTAAGKRFLKSEHIVATFADGRQANPRGVNESVEGGAQLTKTISFGTNKFPIVAIEID